VQEEASYLSYLKSQEAHTVFRLAEVVTDCLRNFLAEKGFVEFLPPVLSSVTDPGLRGAERLKVSIYGEKAYMMSSMVFHKQVLATAFDRIYCFSPNVRLEPLANASSGRHLVEFCQLDLEEADATFEDSMFLAEEMLQRVVSCVVSEHGDLLERLGRRLNVPSRPFRRFTYRELLDFAASHGLKVTYGEELPQCVESAVSEQAGGFFWITEYPKTCRGFYYRETADPDATGTVRSMDLIYPEGFGEAISGGEREYRPDHIFRRIVEAGLEPGDFEEFLRVAKEGLRPTSGFGIGVERLVRYITGEREIWRVRPFPKVPGRVGM